MDYTALIVGGALILIISAACASVIFGDKNRYKAEWRKEKEHEMTEEEYIQMRIAEENEKQERIKVEENAKRLFHENCESMKSAEEQREMASSGTKDGGAKRFSKKRDIAVWLIAVAVVLAFSIGFFISNNEETFSPSYPQVETVYGIALGNTDEDFFYATSAAVEIVKDSLKYPSNSIFQEQRDMSVYYKSAQGIYTVQGYVLASNGFGVREEKDFTARFKLRFVDNGNRFTWYDVQLII